MHNKGFGTLISRDSYLEDILRFRDTDLIKVVTGVRRCGKSSLLALVQERLHSEGVADEQLLDLNLESKKVRIETEDELYEYFSSRMPASGKAYLFIDEPQRVPGWQNAVNALRVDFDCDIYLTGSNAYLLSSELSTYLSGRYIETKVLPLSFEEYARFLKLEFSPGSSVALSPDGRPVLFADLLNRYLVYGGMPAIASLDTDQTAHSAYLSGIYDAIAVRDIINRERAGGRSVVTDAGLLRSITEFLADNIGSECSPNSIANALTSGGRKADNKTVGSYLAALNDAYLFYRVSRYDLHGKQILKTNPKEYLVDLGFRSYLAGYRTTDIGRRFENAVYLQLLYMGWAVHVGKLYGKEIDFVAVKDGERLYVQACDNMMAGDTKTRELSPLKSIRDGFRKIVVVREGTYETDIDGIKIVPAREFFVSNER